MRILFFSGLIVLNLGAMAPRHRMSWYHYQLKDLVDTRKSKSNLEMSEKQAYVEFCKKLYEKSKKRLDEVTQETNGYVCGTEDPEVARDSYKKLFIKNVMEYSPSDIGVLGFQIEGTLKDYLAGRN